MMSAWYFYYSQFMRKSENQLTRTTRLPLTSLCLLSDSEHIACVCGEFGRLRLACGACVHFCAMRTQGHGHREDMC